MGKTLSPCSTSIRTRPWPIRSPSSSQPSRTGNMVPLLTCNIIELMVCLQNVDCRLPFTIILWTSHPCLPTRCPPFSPPRHLDFPGHTITYGRPLHAFGTRLCFARGLYVRSSFWRGVFDRRLEPLRSGKRTQSKRSRRDKETSTEI